MDLKYLKDHIHEELTDAREYIEKAIEMKVSHPAWTSTFVNMADAEVNHATNLMKMFEQCVKDKIKKDGNMPEGAEHPETMYKDAMKVYGETMTYITNMKRGL